MTAVDEPGSEGRREARRHPAPLGAEAQQLADLIPIGIALLTPEGQVLLMNEAGRDLLGQSGSAASFFDLLPSADRDAAADAVSEALAANGSVHLVVQPTTDTFYELSLTARPAGAAAEGLVVAVTFQDVTFRCEATRHLEHRASHDALTGLRNRAWLLDLLHTRLAASEPLVIAFIDLDRFKVVNDELGHHVGDGLLTQIAASVGRSLHPGEVAARVGGDEFVVVAPKLDDEQLADLDQRLRLAVATVPIAREHGIGVSVGTTRSEDDDEPWSLLRRADAAMYAHKRQTERRRTLRERRRQAGLGEGARSDT